MVNQIEQLNNEGVRYFLSGNLISAKKKYEEALKQQPNYATTLNNLGMLHLQEKKFDQAITYFQNAIEEKDSATYRLNMGHALANKKMFKEAERHYKLSLAFDENSLETWKSLATLYQAQNRHLEAIKIWIDIIENRDNNPLYKIYLAKDYIKIQEYQYALNVLAQASQQDTYLDLTWYYTALIHFDKKNFDLAKKAIKNAIGIKPNNESYRSLLATMYLCTSNISEAFQEWKYILLLNPNNEHVRIDRAVTLLSQKSTKKALQELTIVLTVNEHNLKALFYKALTKLELKKKDAEAIKILKTLSKGQNDYSVKAKEILSKI